MAGNDFTLTRTQIITSAIRKLGAIPSGGSATSDQLSEGADALNAMVKAWQNIGVRLWTVEWVYQGLNAGTRVYYPDPILDVQKAFVRRSDTDYPVKVVGLLDYFDVEDKTDTGLVEILAFKPDKASPEIHVYPVPENSTDILHFLQVKKLEDFDAATDKGDFPSRWLQALIWNLAGELSREYSVPVDVEDRITSRATAYLELAIKGEKNSTSTSNFVRSAY